MKNKSVNKLHIEKIIKTVTVIFIIAVVSVMAFSGCSVKNPDESNQTSETSATTHENTTTASEKVTAEKYNTYDSLLNQMNAKLEKRDFPEKAKKLFKEILDGLWNNYSGWEKGYKDMPSKYEYIKVNLIDNIDNINGIKWYDINSKKAQEMLKDGSAEGFTEPDFVITVIMDDEAEGNAETLYHEIAHCKQNKIVYEGNCFNGYEDIWDLFIEGGATFHMKFLNDVNSELNGAWGIENSDGSKNLNYLKANCCGYLLDMNLYEKLVYLAGYKIIDAVERGEKWASFATVRNKIAENYDKETADKIIELMIDLYNTYNESYKGDELYNLAIELENAFLDCIKRDIKKLNKNDTEQIKKYNNIISMYKSKNMPLENPEFSTDYQICDKINIRQVERLLAKKQ